MKAVILAGGEGTRLRPLTLGTPKPIVPVVDRPFLRYQLDLLASVGVRDVVFSLAYRPERIRAVFGDGSDFGFRIVYAVEDVPLGTGGAIKNAEANLDDETIVFNGDVLSDVDLTAVVARHRQTRAVATIVLTPVANPSAYGLVETDADGRVRRFVEKPRPDQVTTNTINAGIYVLDTRSLALMPAGQPYSIERGFFPSLLERGELVRGHVHAGYWIDIGTPGKYLQVHRDILERRFRVVLEAEPRGAGYVAASATIDAAARLTGSFFIGPGCRVEAGAEVGPLAVLASDVQVGAGALVRDSVVWPGSRLGPGARVEGALLGHRVALGANARVTPGAVLGDDTELSDFSGTGAEPAPKP